MIRSKLVKWLAASALTLAAIPAIGLGHHASHVSASTYLAGMSTSVAATDTKSVSHVATKKHKHRHKKHAASTSSHKGRKHKKHKKQAA